MIFDGVIGSPIDVLGDDRPLVALHSVEDEEDPLFFLAPLVFLDCGVQVVVPSLTALLADTTF